MSGRKSGGKSGRFGKGHDPRRGKGPPKGRGGRPSNAARKLLTEIEDRGLREMKRRMGPKLIQKLDDRTVKDFTDMAVRQNQGIRIKLEARDALAEVLGCDPSELPPPRR